MRKFVLAALLPLIAVGLAVVPAPFASAQRASVAVTASSLRVWPGDCDYADYRLTVNGNWADWTADIRISKPGGGSAAADYMYKGGSTSGDVFLCSFERRGTYRVTATVDGYDEDYNVVDTVTATTTFEFSVRKKARTHLAVATKHVRHGFWTIKGTLTKQGRPYAHRRVSIQAKIYGVWGNLKTKVTDRSGVVRFTSHPKKGAGKYKVRLLFKGSDRVTSAATRTFRLYP